MDDPVKSSYNRELLSNQIWQGLNFVSKAATLALLTPWMLKIWGKNGYGEFALASSLLVSMAVLDGGVRNFVRIRLCEVTAQGETYQAQRTLGVGLLAFGCVVLAAFLGSLLLSGLYWWKACFHLSSEGNWLMASTMGMVGLFMWSTILLEPLAASGRLSLVKAANTIGAVTALPILSLCLLMKSSVTQAVMAYFFCIIFPNFYLFLKSDFYQNKPWKSWQNIGWSEMVGAWKGGWWYYVTTLSLITKTHALTFVVSALYDPSVAGFFYITLRIAEIIGTLGSAASDTALASLASARSVVDQVARFRQSYQYAGLFTLYAVVAVALSGDTFLRLWLGAESIPSGGLCWALAAFGLAGSWSKIVVNSSIGLNMAREGALGNAIEAILVLLSAVVLPRWFGIPGLLWGGAISVLALVPCARSIAEVLGYSWLRIWITPLSTLTLGLVISGLILGGAVATQNWIAISAALCVLGGLALVSWRKLHR